MHKPLIAVGIVCGCLLVGCWRQQNPAGNTPDKVIAESQTSAQAFPEEPSADPALPPQQSVMDEAATPSHSPSERAATPDIDSPVTKVQRNADEASTSTTVAAAESGGTAEDEPSLVEPAWTQERLVLLAPGGPRLIDLRVNVGGHDLVAGFAEESQWIAQQLEFRFDTPITWEALLDLPLVQSGWLGNLVPSAEQRSELIAMYDKDPVGTVEEAEFRAFVTRGLARRDPIRIARSRSVQPSARWNSPWGPLDPDQDRALTREEISHTAAALMHVDFDGDGIISEAELRSTSDSMADATGTSRSGGILDMALVLSKDAKQPTAIERAVLEHYSFTETLPRDAFFAWSDDRWRALDAKSVGQLSKHDLAALHDLAADARLDVVMPNTLAEAEDRTERSAQSGAATPARSAKSKQASAQVQASQTGAEAQGAWTAGTIGGRLVLPGCIVLVTLRDDYSWQARRQACQQLARAVDDPQLAMAIAGPLELKDSAWELVREHGADGPALAWRWAVAPRHFQFTASWTAVETPWFELVDADGDRRLTAREVTEFASTAERWDRNADGRLDEEELPLVVALTFGREDNRLANFTAGGSNTEKGGISIPTGPSWFAAMDYNSDGEVTHAEFLGEEGDFEALDANDDGMLDVREVYTPD